VARYFASGSGSDSNDGLSWSTPKLTLAAALALATASGDIVAIDVANSPGVVTATTIWTVLNNISIIASTNPGSGTTVTPAKMIDYGTIVGSNTNNVSVTVNGAYSVYLYGIQFKNSGTSNATFQFGSTTLSRFVFDTCYFYLGTTSSSARITFGTTSNAVIRHVLIDCEFRFSHITQSLTFNAYADLYGCIAGAAGTLPTILVSGAARNDTKWYGCNLSGIVGSLVGDGSVPTSHTFYGCTLGNGVTPLVSQSGDNGSGNICQILDSAYGDFQGFYGYYAPQGSVVLDTGTLYTGSPAGGSWKIVTNSGATPTNPFVTPSLPLFHSGVSSITPRVECLRNDGTASAPTDAEVWLRIGAKVTSGSTMMSQFLDAASVINRVTSAGAAQAAGAGTGSWTIASSNSPYSFKIDSGAALTPAETGYLDAHICVAGARTIFVDPQPRVV